MASSNTMGSANVLPKDAAATRGPRNSFGTSNARHTPLPSTHPKNM